MTPEERLAVCETKTDRNEEDINALAGEVRNLVKSIGPLVVSVKLLWPVVLLILIGILSGPVQKLFAQ